MAAPPGPSPLLHNPCWEVLTPNRGPGLCPRPRGFVTQARVRCPEDPPLLGQSPLLDLSLDYLHVFATMSTADVDGSVQMTLFFPSEAEALL